ncbi:histidine phosphatase family protein [Sphingomonas sp. LB-2]|uniref:SixA phosphatase family protein n=1 Tax=Sphingomonas caeni TaxID=2984949 RepID=UPI00222EF135|nr:phosphoglycerate mutase family protein [Sphingomonas caeni]MCW3847464.1 histidine phosphatase family protein [Sphingomonas caeni]
MLKLLLTALVAALLGAAALASLPAAQTVYVMRHLNTPEGERDPDLTEAGKAGAGALVRWFHGKKLTAIYVSDFKRTRQTAEPLAAERGITVKLYDPRDTPGLIAKVRAEPGPVLVIGHSNTVPDLVEQLGGTRPGPLAHPDFGDIWTVTGGKTDHAKIP